MSDGYLISGAGLAARAKGDMILQEGKNWEIIGNAIENLGKQLDKKKKANHDYTEAAERILDNAGELSAEEYAAIHDLINEKKKVDFINAVKEGNNKKQALQLREISMMGNQCTDYKDTRETLAKNVFMGNTSNQMKHDPRGQAVLRILDDDKPHLVQKKCPEGVNCKNKDEMGIMMPAFDKMDAAEDELRQIMQDLAYLENPENIRQLGYRAIYDNTSSSPFAKKENVNNENNEVNQSIDIDNVKRELNIRQTQLKAFLDSDPEEWTSLQSMKRNIKLKDINSANFLTAQADSFYKVALNSQPDTDLEFDTPRIKRIVDKRITKDGDMYSMIYDEMINGRVFYDDFRDMIMGKNVGGRTYRDLGINEEDLKGADRNMDSIIDQEEANVIAKSILSNPATNEEGLTMIQEYLSNYFIMFFKNNHEQGIKHRDKRNESNKNKGTSGQYVPGTL